MPDICRDNRFKVIAKYKKRLIEGTNIESRPEEMAVIDSILFRFWQMGWLDAIDTVKLQAKMLHIACEMLARYESEEPCNTLFYIKEQREKCDERCCCDKTPDEWCWRRYFTLIATEDNPTPDRMQDTPWEVEDARSSENNTPS